MLPLAIYSHHFSARFRPKPRCRPGVRAFGLKASSGKMRFWFLCCHSALWPWQIFILHGQAAAILPSKLQPGPASITHDPGSSSYFLTNGVLNARVSIKDGILQPIHLTNTMSGQRLPDPEYAFQVEIAGGRISSRDFQLLSANLSRLEPQAEASQLSLRHSGWSISFLLATGSLEARWSVVLRDDSNSIKVAFRMWPRPNQRDSALRVGEVCLLSGILNGGAVAGVLKGCQLCPNTFSWAWNTPKPQIPSRMSFTLVASQSKRQLRCRRGKAPSQWALWCQGRPDAHSFITWKEKELTLLAACFITTLGMTSEQDSSFPQGKQKPGCSIFPTR